jgi:ATP-dependent Clp protease, protease subunit
MKESMQIPGSALEAADRIRKSPNRFYLRGEINPASTIDILKGIRKLESSDKTQELVTIEVNSVGGSTETGVELALVMEQSPLEIATLTTFRSESSAVLVSASGAKGLRLAYPESVFLLHPSRVTLNGNQELPYVEETLARGIDGEKRFKDILAKATGKSVESISRKMRSRTIFDAEAAKRYGLIDHIFPRKPRK